MQEPWFDKILTRDVLRTIARVAGGALMAASSLIGWPAVLLSAAATTGIFVYQQSREQESKERMCLNLYKHELGQLLHKAPDSVTLDDMKLAAKPVAEGGLGIVTLEKQLAYYDYKRRWVIGVETAVTGVVAVGLAIFSAYMGASPLVGMGAVGGAMALLQQGAYGLMNASMSQYSYKFSVNKHLFDISAELEKQPIKPERVLGLFIDADPQLQAHVRERYGNDYDRLAIYKKTQVMKALEPTLRTEALTHEINHGNIRPSLIGFLAYGQGNEALADYARYQSLFSQPLTVAAAGDSAPSIEYAARITTERTAAAHSPGKLH